MASSRRGRALAHSADTRNAGFRSKAHRPRLEALEDRCTPATFTVNTLSDPGTLGDNFLSLREAIQAVNAQSLAGFSAAELAQVDQTSPLGTNDTVQFSVTGTIDLSATSGPLALSRTVAILGPGSASLSISGQNAVRVFSIASGVSSRIEGLTITQGNAGTSVGGGIANSGGTVTLTDCTLSGNTTTTSFGGGIFNNFGTLTLTDCTLSGNTAGANGGGIANQIGTVTLTDCTLSGNRAGSLGGGIASGGGTVTLNNSTLSNNSAPGSNGGGIFHTVGSTVRLNNSIVANSTGGDIVNAGGTLQGSQTWWRTAPDRPARSPATPCWGRSRTTAARR